MLAEGIAPPEVYDEPAGVLHPGETFTPYNPLARACWEQYRQQLQAAVPDHTRQLRRAHARGVAKPRRFSLYFVQAGAGPVKIGVTTNVERRLATLRNGSAFPVALLGAYPISCRECERAVHRRFAAQRLEGEWFAPSADLLDFARTYRDPYARADGIDAPAPDGP